MIILYMLLGVVTIMLLVLTFAPKNKLLDGGWPESQIDAIKGFFHTTNLFKKH
jgi:hypothetical protein